MICVFKDGSKSDNFFDECSDNFLMRFAISLQYKISLEEFALGFSNPNNSSADTLKIEVSFLMISAGGILSPLS